MWGYYGKMRHFRRLLVLVTVLLLLCLNIDNGEVISIQLRNKTYYLKEEFETRGTCIRKNSKVVQSLRIGEFSVVSSDGITLVLHSDALNTKQYINADSECLLVKETFNKGTYNSAISVLGVVPQGVQNCLIEGNWKISIYDGKLEDVVSNRSENRVVGVTLPYEKEILLANDSEAVLKSLLHEVGHVIDRVYDDKGVSSSSEFVAIYEREKRGARLLNCNVEYCTSNSCEYFAECFNQYMLYGKVCKDNQPETYKFIKEYIDNLK